MTSIGFLEDLDIDVIFLNGSIICYRGRSECDPYEMYYDSYSIKVTCNILFDHNNILYFGEFKCI